MDNLDDLLGIDWGSSGDSVAARMSLGVPAIFATVEGDAWLVKAEKLIESTLRTPSLALTDADIEWLDGHSSVSEYADWLETHIPGWYQAVDFSNRYTVYLAQKAEAERLARMTEREREALRKRKEKAEARAKERAEAAAQRQRDIMKAKRREENQARGRQALDALAEYYKDERRLPRPEDGVQHANLRYLLNNIDAYALVDISSDPNRAFWCEKVEAVACFIEEFGEFPKLSAVGVGRKVNRAPQYTEAELAEWVAMQARRMGNHQLALSSAVYLERHIPGWGLTRKQRRFAETLSEYNTWVAEKGIPSRRKAESQRERELAEFASKWRSRLKSELTVEARVMYQAEDFDTSALSATRNVKTWDQMFHAFRFFVRTYKRMPVRRADASLYVDDEADIAVWLKNQRGYNFSKLTDEQLILLDGVDTRWRGQGKRLDGTASKQASRCDDYCRWVVENKRLPLLTATDPDEKSFAVWFKGNKNKREGKMGRTASGAPVGWNAEREEECKTRFGEHWHAHARSTIFRTSVYEHIINHHDEDGRFMMA